MRGTARTPVSEVPKPVRTRENKFPVRGTVWVPVPGVPEPVRTPDIGRAVPKPVLPPRISIIAAGALGISIPVCGEISCLLSFGVDVE